MKRQSTCNGYTLSVDNQILSIAKDSDLISFSIGEGDTLANLVGVLSKMKGLPVFPPVIRTSPFVANIDDEIVISHNARAGSVKTTWSQLDQFVEAVYAITKIALDMVTLGGDRAQPAGGNYNDGLAH